MYLCVHQTPPFPKVARGMYQSLPLRTSSGSKTLTGIFPLKTLDPHTQQINSGTCDGPEIRQRGLACANYRDRGALVRSKSHINSLTSEIGVARASLRF